jgi:predicted enzyme related to lactoylglutathione lyase
MFKTGEAQRGGGMPIPEGVEAPPAWMTYIGTPAIDATWAKAESLGAEAIRTPFDVPTVGRLAIFKDPTGAVIGIFTPDAQ